MSRVQIITSSNPVINTDDHIGPREADVAFDCKCDPCVIIYSEHIHPGGNAPWRERMATLNLTKWDAQLWEDKVLRSLLWTVDDGRLLAYLKTIISPDYDGFGMIDTEAGAIWPGRSDFPVGHECWKASDKFDNECLKICRDYAPSAKWGLYNRGYVMKNWRSSMDRIMTTFHKAQAQRDTLNVDIWYPSIYDATEGISDIHDSHVHGKVGFFASDDRLLYCVVNPYVMASSGWVLATREEFDRDQLSLADKAGADGICIWINRYHAVNRGWVPPSLRGLSPDLEWKRAHMDKIVNDTWSQAYDKFTLGIT